ncbi:MAG: hypothetical protein ACXWFC_14210 [Nitrososphaeraceae archaeon]
MFSILLKLISKPNLFSSFSVKTALESLSCGLKVLNHELKYIDKLPEEHHSLML